MIIDSAAAIEETVYNGEGTCVAFSPSFSAKDD
jgi:hypothetical protein